MKSRCFLFFFTKLHMVSLMFQETSLYKWVHVEMVFYKSWLISTILLLIFFLSITLPLEFATRSCTNNLIAPSPGLSGSLFGRFSIQTTGSDAGSLGVQKTRGRAWAEGGRMPRKAAGSGKVQREKTPEYIRKQREGDQIHYLSQSYNWASKHFTVMIKHEIMWWKINAILVLCAGTLQTRRARLGTVM